MTKSFKTCIILFLISLTLTLRSPNEWLFTTTGSDAHAYEFLTNQLLSHGYLIWILSPLSYLGMYPYSYTSGPMVFTGTLSLITGLDMDLSILFYSLNNSIIGTLFAFFIGRIFFRKNMLPAIVIAISYSLNHYFLIHTIWRFSTRAMFMSLLPFLLWSLFKSVSSFNKYRYIFLSVFSFSLLLTIHRMNTYSMVTIIFPLIICYIGTFFISRIYVKGIFNHKQSKYFLLALLGVIFITVINFREKYQDLGFPIRETWLFNEYNYPFIGEYLNIFRTYSERGILFFLVIPGIFYLFSKQNKNYLEIAFILIIFFQIFWILDAEYFFPIVSITLSVIIGYGFQSLKNIIKSKNQALAFCIAFIFIIPISFSIFQRDIATRVQIERDWPVWYDGTEHDDTSLWRSAYIDEEDMILSDSTEVHKLGDNGKIMLLEDNIIIWKWRNVSDSLVVEPLTITDVLFHQPGLHYGGKVTDWTTGERDIFGEKHEGYILRMVEVRPSYKNLIEYYELKWIISLNRSDWAEDYEFVESSKETSYSIYSNELFTVLYYKSW